MPSYDKHKVVALSNGDEYVQAHGILSQSWRMWTRTAVIENSFVALLRLYPSNDGPFLAGRSRFVREGSARSR
jgi:hypothetical protein